MFPSHPHFRSTAGPSRLVRAYATGPPPPTPAGPPSSSPPAAPSARPHRFHPGQNPTIPLAEDLSAPRTFAQAEKYFRRIAGNPETRLPTRTMKWLGVGGWVVGAGEWQTGRTSTKSAADEPGRDVAASTYMVLYADFGDHEHVFSPVSLRASAPRLTPGSTRLSPDPPPIPRLHGVNVPALAARAKFPRSR